MGSSLQDLICLFSHDWSTPNFDPRLYRCDDEKKKKLLSQRTFWYHCVAEDPMISKMLVRNPLQALKKPILHGSSIPKPNLSEFAFFVNFYSPSNWWVSLLQKSELAVRVLGLEKLGLGLDNCGRTTKNAYCRIYGLCFWLRCLRCHAFSLYHSLLRASVLGRSRVRFSKRTIMCRARRRDAYIINYIDMQMVDLWCCHSAFQLQTKTIFPAVIMG